MIVLRQSLFQRAAPGCSPTVSQDRALTVLFFTDGSGYEGQVGSSAVAPREGIFQRRYLGTADQSTVYVAELSGIEMVLAKFAKIRQNRHSTRMDIFSDSQAAIQVVQNPKRSSGQFVLQRIYDYVRHDSRRDSLDPAHVGVPWQ